MKGGLMFFKLPEVLELMIDPVMMLLELGLKVIDRCDMR
jgi:hypothetical protein